MPKLSDADRARVRYHLGYINVQSVVSLGWGIPQPTQTLYLVEAAMSRVIPDIIPKILQILQIMDGVETKLVEAQTRLAAIALGSLKLREQEGDQLEHEYVRWGSRLADILGCPIYPYSARYRNAGGRAGMIPVRNG